MRGKTETLITNYKVYVEMSKNGAFIYKIVGLGLNSSCKSVCTEWRRDETNKKLLKNSTNFILFQP